MPNWNAMTIPVTTPRPNTTAKIFSQNSKTPRYAGRPVRRYIASSTVSHAAMPIENAGKMMWNDIVKANCRRDRSNAVSSIAGLQCDDGIDREYSDPERYSFHNA